MRTTVDGSGRLVIPRGMRSQIGLAEGGEVDIAVHGAAILIEPVAGADLQKEGRYLVIPPTGSAIDDDTVRESRLADQR